VLVSGCVARSWLLTVTRIDFLMFILAAGSWGCLNRWTQFSVAAQCEYLFPLNQVCVLTIIKWNLKSILPQFFQTHLASVRVWATGQLARLVVAMGRSRGCDTAEG